MARAAGYKRAMPHMHNYDVEKYKYVYLPLAQGGFEALAGDSDATVATGDYVQSVASGNPSMMEAGSSGCSGLYIDAAGDTVQFMWPR